MWGLQKNGKEIQTLYFIKINGSPFPLPDNMVYCLVPRNKSFLRDLEVEALVPAIIKVVLLLLLQALNLHHLGTINNKK